MEGTPVSQLASLIFARMERARFEGQIDGGMILLAADGLRIKLARERNDEIVDTELPLTTDEIADIDPAAYDGYAEAMMAGGLQVLAALEKNAEKALGSLKIVR